MSSEGLRYEHGLDRQLADSRLFAWIRPAIHMAIKHWPIAVGAGFATLCALRGLAWVDIVPWSGGLVWSVVESAINATFLVLALSLIEVITYRLLVEKERLGVLNDWGLTLIRTTQIALIWWTASVIVVGVIVYLSFVMLIRDLNALSELQEPLDFVALYARNRFWDIVQLIVYFALAPVFASVAVAALLSNIHAVRSRKPALDCIRDSFRLAFDQRWRVFLGSLIIALVAWLLDFLGRRIPETDFSFPFAFRYYIEQSVIFASAAFGLGMTFVIERAYAAHLTLPEESEGGAPLPGGASPTDTAPSPGGGPPSQPVGAMQRASGARAPMASPSPAVAIAPPAQASSTAPAAPLAQASVTASSALPPAAPHVIAAEIADALRTQQIHRLAENVERGLAADKNFFVSQPDNTLVLAKRLDSQRRSDLALRIALPYLKTQRGHRQHFTTALFVADVLGRDPQRLTEAARFLAQVKALYPREPMLDQMIRKTDDAIAAAAGSRVRA